MRRRVFVALMATSFTPLIADAPYECSEWCLIELTYQGEPVTEAVRTVFRMNSRMKATFRSGSAFLCDGATLRREGEPDPFSQHQFQVIQFTPSFYMDLEWLITDRDLTIQELVEA